MSFHYNSMYINGMIVEKMSRQPAPKISHQVKPQPNKEQELYQNIEMQEEPSHYMTINRPNRIEFEDKSQPAGQISTKIKRWKCVVIALTAVFLVIALIVSLVAIIMYSPLVRSGDNTVSYSAQIASMQSLIQTSTLVQNNLRQDLDRLRTINLYEGCIKDTRTCTITQSGITSFASCNTGYVNINPAVSLIHYKHMIKCTAHNHINPMHTEHTEHTVLHIQHIV